MADTGFWSDNTKAKAITKEAAAYEKILNLLLTLDTEIVDLQELLNLSKEEDDVLKDIQKQVKSFEEKLVNLEEESFYGGEYDDLNAMISINAGAGGVDANDWAQILYRMYTRYFDDNGMEYTIEELSNAEEAGIKSVSITVSSYRAYATLESERGVHRLVRISPFDSNKRRHTSFAGVDVIPLIENSDEVEIKDDEIRIDVYRASGAGGQHVNTTDSAVRITHLPTGLSVSQQDEKSQHKNKAKGMKILRARLYELERSRIDQERSKDRKTKIGSGDRSERIRTYNFPQGRVTDHRINLTLHRLEEFLEGEAFDEMIESLTLQAQEDSLSNLN
jgi:peptide chain release factor 1